MILNQFSYQCNKNKFIFRAPNQGLIDKLWKTRQNSFKSKFEGCNLIVKNLPKTVDEKEFRNMFKAYGDVSSVKIATHGVMKDIIKNNMVVDKEFIYESKGHGYVCYKNAESAKEVFIHLESLF